MVEIVRNLPWTGDTRLLRSINLTYYLTGTLPR